MAGCAEDVAICLIHWGFDKRLVFLGFRWVGMSL